jgi:hypothetical protein
VLISEMLLISAGGVLGFLSRHFLAAYLNAYSEQKGKNLATFEDIKLLLEQVRTVTRTTEEIKAEVTNDVWLRQVQWNFRRDVYIRLLEALADKWSVVNQIEVQGALSALQVRLEAADLALHRAGGVALLAIQDNGMPNILESLADCKTTVGLRSRMDAVVSAAKDDLNLICDSSQISAPGRLPGVATRQVFDYKSRQNPK